MNENEMYDYCELELPDDLYYKIMIAAEAEGKTVDDYVSDLLQESLDNDEFEKLIESIKKEGTL